MAWSRMALLLTLGAALLGCGGSSPAAPMPISQTLTAELTSLDAGAATAGNTLRFPISVAAFGPFQARLSWVVLAPGSGTFGGAAPSFAMYLDDGAIKQGAGPSSMQPVTLSADVRPQTYTLQVTNFQACGGCVTRATVEVSHP